jgi:hypothetical protein
VLLSIASNILKRPPSCIFRKTDAVLYPTGRPRLPGKGLQVVLSCSIPLSNLSPAARVVVAHVEATQGMGDDTKAKVGGEAERGFREECKGPVVLHVSRVRPRNRRQGNWEPRNAAIQEFIGMWPSAMPRGYRLPVQVVAGRCRFIIPLCTRPDGKGIKRWGCTNLNRIRRKGCFSKSKCISSGP